MATGIGATAPMLRGRTPETDNGRIKAAAIVESR
jgi:hypothetical protein